jgi:hypothetical protein
METAMMNVTGLTCGGADHSRAHAAPPRYRLSIGGNALGLDR